MVRGIRNKPVQNAFLAGSGAKIMPGLLTPKVSYSVQGRTITTNVGQLYPVVPSMTAVSDLSVTIDFGGGVQATFLGSNAVDKGDFVGQSVRQKSFLCTNGLFPDWRVWFRVDADVNGNRIVEPNAGWRDEVIVEYGTAIGRTPTHLLTPYVATITKGGSQVYQNTVPMHFWYARWRYQSSQRAIVRTPAQLKARNWILNFGSSGLYGLQPSTVNVTWPGPMGTPGTFNPAMGSAGDNLQIGFVTEFFADYIINGTAASLTTVRSEGEWYGNASFHIRDSTGVPLNIQGFPNPNMINYTDNGGTIGREQLLNTGVYPNSIAVDGAHMYPAPTGAWLMTEDPWMLEELQFMCNWQLLNNSFHRGVNNLPGLVYPASGSRSFAWGIRDLFTVAATMPSSTPSWLLPKSYFQACIGDNKLYLTGDSTHIRYMNSPARIHTLFKFGTRTDQVDAWMQSWLTTMIGYGVLLGFSDWLPIYQWWVDFHIQMTNGTSGWSRQWPVPYGCLVNKNGNVNQGTMYFSTNAVDASTCTSWADFWNYYKSGSIHCDTNGNPINYTVSSLTQSGGVATCVANINSDYAGSGGSYITIGGASDPLYNGVHLLLTRTGQLPATMTFSVPANAAASASGAYLNKMKTDQSGHVIDDSGWDGTTIKEWKDTSQYPHPAGAFSFSYALHLQAALTMAVTQNINGASSIYNWYTNQMTTHVIPDCSNPLGQARFSIDPPVASPFSNLAANTARNLGSYAIGNTEARGITSYSGIVYDPVGRRMLIHGAGHGDSQDNELRQLTLTGTPTWGSVYGMTPLAVQVTGNLNMTNAAFYYEDYPTDATPSGKPVAAHSYDTNVVVGNKFYRMSTNTHCNVTSAILEECRAWWYDLNAGTWGFSQYHYGGSPYYQWKVNGTAVLDPVSQNIILIGPDTGAFTRLYVYNPATDTVLLNKVLGSSLSSPPYVGNGSMVYVADDDKFYYVDVAGFVWTLVLDRTTWSNSAMTRITPTGTTFPGSLPAPQPWGFAYDSINKKIGGYVKNGVIYLLDVSVNPPNWITRTMNIESGSAGTPNQVYYCIDFDPIGGVFIFMDTNSAYSWAYKYG